MKILVTGATGFIGKQLCIELLKKGHDLVVVGRSSEKNFREGFSLPCEYFTWENLKISDISAVYHLAGEPIASSRWTEKKKERILSSRVSTTEKLLKAFKGQWPKTFIAASAIGIYGDRKDEKLTEESTCGLGFIPTVCKAWEESSVGFEPFSRVVRIRIGIVLNNQEGFLKPIEQIFSFGLGGQVSTGKQWMSWIHYKDLVNLLIFSLEEPIEGTFNAVSPNPITNKHWTKAFSKQLGFPALFPAPKIALKLALGEMSCLALDSQNVSSEKIVSKNFHFEFETIESALKEIYQWKKRRNEKIFETDQWINHKRSDVFPFFSDAKNLEKITPPWLHFKILDQSTPLIEEETILNYKISIKGIPVKWRTRILNWKPPQVFIDDQLKGPYKKWHHRHIFEDLPNGSLMKDHVVYEVPMGLLGHIFLGLYIRSDIHKIFSYRNKIISQMKEFN